MRGGAKRKGRRRAKLHHASPSGVRRAAPLNNHSRSRPWLWLQAIEERRKLLEEQRMAAARIVLAGKSILVPWGTDDPFGGMSPQVRSTVLCVLRAMLHT